MRQRQWVLSDLNADVHWTRQWVLSDLNADVHWTRQWVLSDLNADVHWIPRILNADSRRRWLRSLSHRRKVILLLTAARQSVFSPLSVDRYNFLLPLPAVE